MCLEREIGVVAHCQHSRRSHTLLAKLSHSENVSGGERTPTSSPSLSLVSPDLWRFYFCTLRQHFFS